MRSILKKYRNLLRFIIKSLIIYYLNKILSIYRYYILPSSSIATLARIKYSEKTSSFYFENNNTAATSPPTSSKLIPESQSNEKRPGNKINHEKFGDGIIIRKNGDSLDIVFEKCGLKTIKESYIKLI